MITYTIQYGVPASIVTHAHTYYVQADSEASARAMFNDEVPDAEILRIFPKRSAQMVHGSKPTL